MCRILATIIAYGRNTTQTHRHDRLVHLPLLRGWSVTDATSFVRWQSMRVPLTELNWTELVTKPFTTHTHSRPGAGPLQLQMNENALCIMIMTRQRSAHSQGASPYSYRLKRAFHPSNVRNATNAANARSLLSLRFGRCVSCVFFLGPLRLRLFRTFLRSLRTLRNHA